jgi:hypothetical protein
MKFSSLIVLSTFATSGLADAFEPADFNVTDALVKSGVDIYAIPELAGLVDRSSSKACWIAVSNYHLPLNHYCAHQFDSATL